MKKLTKEEMMEQLGFALDEFKPAKDAVITLTIDPDRYGVLEGGKMLDQIRKVFPNNGVLLSFKGMSLKAG